MNVFAKLFTVPFLFVLAFTLTSCKEEEQGRPLSYEKGVYKGNLDTNISSETLKKLRKRTSGQSGVRVGNL